MHLVGHVKPIDHTIPTPLDGPMGHSRNKTRESPFCVYYNSKNPWALTGNTAINRGFLDLVVLLGDSGYCCPRWAISILWYRKFTSMLSRSVICKTCSYWKETAVLKKPERQRPTQKDVVFDQASISLGNALPQDISGSSGLAGLSRRICVKTTRSNSFRGCRLSRSWACNDFLRNNFPLLYIFGSRCIVGLLAFLKVIRYFKSRWALISPGFLLCLEKAPMICMCSF